MANAKKRGLGKGLDLIFEENSVENENTSVPVRISDIEPNRNQPRKEFDEQSLQELADSIAQHGILQPLLLRPFPDGGYQIVAGERRWRAARMAGLKEVPAVIREMNDREIMELALIENLQREDLNPLEEAMGYQTLMETCGFTQEKAAKSVGKSRPVIANALRLLSLPQPVKDWIAAGKLSAGHGRALLGFPTEDALLACAKQAVEKELSVREVEKLAQLANKAAAPRPAEKTRGITYYNEVRLSLCEYLGRKVKVDGTAKKGTLQIEFYGEDDLKALLETLSLRKTEKDDPHA